MLRTLRQAIYVAMCCCPLARAQNPGANEDPDVILQRARTAIADHLYQLRNYTCHVAIDRFVRFVSDAPHHKDRIELDVAYIAGRELFSPHGHSTFDDQSVRALVPDGLISNDVFGTHEGMLFTGSAKLAYAGSHKKDAHLTYRFDFSTSEVRNQIVVTDGTAFVATNYTGTLWLDVQTLNLVRLQWKADNISGAVSVRRLQKSARYKSVRIGESTVSLPVDSELSAVDNVGNSRLNFIRLDHCREFKGDAVVTYGSLADQAPTSPANDLQPAR